MLPKISPPAYFDHNASSPLTAAARQAMTDFYRHPRGNPSAMHSFGRATRSMLEHARHTLATALDAPLDAVIFTSGGSEANNLALKGSGARCVLRSAAEHPSVCAAATQAQIIGVDSQGRCDVEALEEALAGVPPPALVSMQWANGETGVLQPLAEALACARKHGAIFHCDAVQALGKVPISFRQAGVDFMSLSAHKIGGPLGIGALLINPRRSLRALIDGGGQEQRRRSGSENVIGALGFAAAAAQLPQRLALMPRLARWRLRLETGLIAWAQAHREKLHILSADAARLPNTCCFSWPGRPAATQAIALDLLGAAVSAGPACSSGRMGSTTPMLAAMGLAPEVAASALRISLGPGNQRRHIDDLLAHWQSLAEKWRQCDRRR